MPLRDRVKRIAAIHRRTRLYDAGVAAEPQSAALIDLVTLSGHEINDLMRAFGFKLAGVCVRPTEYTPRVFDAQDLHAEADAEIRERVRSCKARRVDHALDPAVSEPAGHQNAVDAVEVVRRKLFRIDPADPDLHAARVARVLQRFDDRKIRVVQLRVFADQRDRHAALRVLHAFDHLPPFFKVRHRCVEMQFFTDDLGEMRLFEIQRRFVQRVERQVFDHAVAVHVAEVRDLFKDAVIRDRFVHAQHEDVRRDAHALQFLHGMLCRLGLVLAARAKVRNERNVDIDRVVASDLAPDLPDRLQKRLPLDVADRAADLGDHDVRVRLFADAIDEPLDLVGDVWDRLHRLAEVAALPLARKHVRVDLAGRQVRVPVQILVDEAFIVSEIEVCLSAVLGHVNLAVLIGAHRAGIDVDVRIELLRRDLEASCLQKPSERRRRNALAETGNYPAGHKNVLFHTRSSAFSVKREAPARGGFSPRMDACRSSCFVLLIRRVFGSVRLAVRVSDI